MTDWVKYENDYEKEYYDIKTTNGEIYFQCYPNAGVFHETKKQIQIPEYDVMYFRECKHPWSD